MIRATIGKLTFSIALVIGAGAASAQSAPPATLAFAPDSRIWVEGTSTVKSFKCAARTIDAKIQAAPEGTDAPLATLVRDATVGFETAALDCGNSTMNDHNRKAQKQYACPRNEFPLEGYERVGATATLRGKLLLAGKTNAITFPATITEDNGVIRVKAAKAINMKEWGIKPPSPML